jgi:HD-like signal output (HDOD) protein
MLEDFEAGRIDPKDFPHRAHVEVGYELLRRYRFPEALLHLARGLRLLTAKAGRSDAYHETITVAFLALIAERRLSGQYADFNDFAERNPDLLRKEVLNELYEAERLQSALARHTFILPRS